jgi:HEAT repeat protein
VEETSQRTLSGATKDEPIRRLLLSAARDSADPGVRVESMEILKASAATTEVRHALIYALEHDSNPGVRLKALEGLKDFAQERETRKALTQALLADNNPGIRTQAIDLLVQNKEPAMVGVLQELMQKEDNNYVRLRCRKALLEMNASAEPF